MLIKPYAVHLKTLKKILLLADLYRFCPSPLVFTFGWGYVYFGENVREAVPKEI